MSTTIEALFIGGPKDGERIPVESCVRELRFPVAIPPAPFEPTRSTADATQEIDYVQYVRELLADHDEIRHVVFYCGEPGRLIETLINGYQKA